MLLSLIYKYFKKSWALFFFKSVMMVDGEMMLHQIKTRFDSSVESPRSGNLGWLTGSKTSFSSNDGSSPGHAQCSRSAALFCVAQTRSRPCPVCPSVSPLPSPVCLLLSLSLSFSYKTPSARVWKSNPKSSVFPSQMKKTETPGKVRSWYSPRSRMCFVADNVKHSL